MVLLVLEGGPNTVRTMCELIKKKIPAVVIDGSGRAADVVAYAYSHTTKRWELMTNCASIISFMVQIEYSGKCFRQAPSHFSRAWHQCHVYQRSAPDAWFPAFIMGCVVCAIAANTFFSRVKWHIFRAWCLLRNLPLLAWTLYFNAFKEQGNFFPDYRSSNLLPALNVICLTLRV